MLRILSAAFAGLLVGSLCVAQAADQKMSANKLLTKPEIIAAIKKINGGVNEAQKRKKEWCRHERNIAHKDACEVVHDWLAEIGIVLIAQLDTMKKVVEMADSPTKDRLTLMMDVERLKAEREMAAYRASVVAFAFDPDRK